MKMRKRSQLTILVSIWHHKNMQTVKLLRGEGNQGKQEREPRNVT